MQTVLLAGRSRAPRPGTGLSAANSRDSANSQKKAGARLGIATGLAAAAALAAIVIASTTRVPLGLQDPMLDGMATTPPSERVAVGPREAIDVKAIASDASGGLRYVLRVSGLGD